MNILILTEANETVASGHLLECIVITHTLRKNKCNVTFLINSDIQEDLKKRIDFDFIEYTAPVEENINFFAQLIKGKKICCVVTNLRFIKNRFIIDLKTALRTLGFNDLPIVCIDEFGHRELSCDIVVNPMIDSYYWYYHNKIGKSYCGQEYLILPENLAQYHNLQKEICQEIKQVTVSMGGVDLHGNTILLAKYFPEILPHTKINIVCGGGFTQDKELKMIINDNEHIVFYKNIDFLYKLFYESDIAFCAGGNTLHELAAIGVPAIIIPTMPHELRNGKCFEGKGFGITIEKFTDISKKDVEEAVLKLKDVYLRKGMYNSGKKLCDGLGHERIVKILLESFKTS